MKSIAINLKNMVLFKCNIVKKYTRFNYYKLNKIIILSAYYLKINNIIGVNMYDCIIRVKHCI